ncbi:hypothetical protein CLOM_g5642 [Closterium sp. NIES-68]|nr:hypothetical protein CLOM_g5642 [Closterium sp. NIES-68]GJP63993.1 hypothetical protein CLOP_g21032 [Closterium sp. NIES-67]
MASVSLAATSAAATAAQTSGNRRVILGRNNACVSSSFVPRFDRTFSVPALRIAARRSVGHVSASADRTAVAAATSAGGETLIRALVFDCDGVILESEDLHRRAYNAAFQHFAIRCPGEKAVVDWTTEFYDVLQNKIGGGKPKMRWYFNKNGWPHSSFLPAPPTTDADRDLLIDTLQDWKTNKYQQMIGSGQVPVRPGVLELMDEARQRGLLLAVCSAATKSSVVFTLTSLLGKERFERLDCFLAGDDVPKKKPDPTIYKLAAERLGVPPSSCLVVEDSVIGLQAALGAGMPCVITYTPSTKSQDFTGAVTAFDDLGGVTLDKLISACSAVVA